MPMWGLAALGPICAAVSTQPSLLVWAAAYDCGRLSSIASSVQQNGEQHSMCSMCKCVGTGCAGVAQTLVGPVVISRSRPLLV